jgi:hypothetical protein
VFEGAAGHVINEGLMKGWHSPGARQELVRTATSISLFPKIVGKIMSVYVHLGHNYSITGDNYFCFTLHAGTCLGPRPALHGPRQQVRQHARRRLARLARRAEHQAALGLLRPGRGGRGGGGGGATTRRRPGGSGPLAFKEGRGWGVMGRGEGGRAPHAVGEGREWVTVLAPLGWEPTSINTVISIAYHIAFASN